MNYKTLISTFFFGLAVASQAQVMPSPDASVLIKNINVPVNLYTGVASIDVPLYTVEANNGGQVPIGLQYNTGGIKVSEVAGVAGLGWHLNAGGSISRVMRGEPDEQATFTDVLNYTNVVEQQITEHQDYDREKDLFFFQFPGGGGKFVFSGDFKTWKSGQGGGTLTYGETQILPASDVEVRFAYDSDLDSHWIITDTFGNKYYFGQSSAAREVTKSNSKKIGEQYDSNDEREFISTWHLNKIEYANQPTTDSYTIRFAYTGVTIGNTTADEFKSWRKRLENAPGNTYTISTEEYTASRAIITAKYLSTIVFPKGSVSLSYGERDDLANGRRLRSLSVKDHNDMEVSRITLDQSYFDAADSFLQNGTSNCSGEKCLRLKLNAITKDGLKIRSFDYANDQNISGYDPYELPPRDSYYYDHWGYYNGPINGSVYVSHARNQSPYLEGMWRDPNQYSKANILTKVTFPSGGYTELTYSLHAKHGGVRISKVEDFESEGNRISGTEYQYQGADENDPVFPVYISQAPAGANAAVALWTHSHALSFLFDLNGPTTGYAKMEVHDLNTPAYSRHHFITETESPLTPSQKSMYSVDIHPSNQTGWVNVSYVSHQDFIAPFTTHDLDFYNRGLESKVETFDEAGIKVSEAVNTYQQIDKLDIKNHALYLHSYDLDIVGGEELYNYVVSEYDINVKYLRLANSVAKSFDDNGVLIAQTATDYLYHETYKTLPSEVRSYRNDNTGGEAFDSRSYTYYPSDGSSIDIMHSQFVLDQMVDKNMVGVPVQTETAVKLPGYGSHLTSAAGISTYRIQHGLIQPYQSYELNIEAPTNSWNASDFREVGSQSYNTNGQLESQTGTDGIVTSYVYDAQGYVTSTTVNSGGSIPNRTSTYTYQPLVGIKTVTDPNGRTITNEYDSRNRLHLVKDQNGDIIKRYRYNYASEDEVSAIEIDALNCLYVDVPFEIRATNTQRFYGPTTYHWYLSDGTEITNSSGVISHTFTTTGSHNVKLSIQNAELDNVLKYTQTLNIQSGFDPTICGPYTYDYCSNEQMYAFPGQNCYPNFGQDRMTFTAEGFSGSNSYEWKFQTITNGSSSGWLSFGSNSNLASLYETDFLNGQIPDVVEVQCFVTYCDNATHLLQSSITILDDDCP